MEIIIGMVIAFALGAYVRKPFNPIKKKTAVPEETTEEKTEEERKVRSYFDQLNELINYTGGKHED